MGDVSLRSRAGLALLVRNVATRLRVSERTVRWWARTGRLPAHRDGVKIWAFDEPDVIAFARRREEEWT